MEPEIDQAVEEVQSERRVDGRFVVLAAMGVLLSSSVVLLLLTGWGRGKTGPAERVGVPGVVAESKIDAEVTYLTGSAWKMWDGRRLEIREGDVLKEGDVVGTGEKTRLTLAFDDGSVVRVGADSTVKLTEMVPAKMQVDDQEGEIYARVAKDRNHRFAVAAGGVRVEAMGTAFAVKNKGEGEVEVRVVENQVVVSDGNEETVVEANKTWKEGVAEPVKFNPSQLAKKEEFMAWNFKEDGIVDSVKEQMPILPGKPKTPGAGSISLGGKKTVDAVRLEWAVNGVEVTKGFKVLMSRESGPTYPEDILLEYIADSSVRVRHMGIPDENGKWFFRVCQAVAGENCGVYSNDVEIQVP